MVALSKQTEQTSLLYIYHAEQSEQAVL